MVSEPFTVDAWSDVVCPYCYLGARQLSQALERFEHRDEVVVRHRAFELDPSSAKYHDLSLNELVERKYAMPAERVRAMHDRMEEQARAMGMTWSLATARPTNTFDAHRVITFATRRGLGGEVSERLFRAYFCEGELVSDRSRLDVLAREVGLLDVDRIWRNDAYVEEVRSDEAAAMELGISGVPSFLVDGRFMIVGAQGVDQILEVLVRAWARRAA